MEVMDVLPSPQIPLWHLSQNIPCDLINLVFLPVLWTPLRSLSGVSCSTGNVLEKATAEILDPSHPLSSLNSPALPPTYYHRVEVTEECFCFAHFLQRGFSSVALPVRQQEDTSPAVTRRERGTAWIASCFRCSPAAVSQPWSAELCLHDAPSAGQSRQFAEWHMTNPFCLAATWNQIYTLKCGIVAIYFSVKTVAKMNLFHRTEFAGLNCCSLRHWLTLCGLIIWIS